MICLTSCEPAKAYVPNSKFSLSVRQVRLALIDAGKTLAEVGAAITAISDIVERQKGEIDWEYATEFRRLHPLMAALSDALGFTPEKFDALWASALEL